MSTLVSRLLYASIYGYMWINTCSGAFRHWFRDIPVSALHCVCVQFEQPPLSLSFLKNLTAYSWEIRWRPVLCLPSLIRPQSDSFQDEMKMASVNPALRLQAVIQCASLGTGWGCSRERCSRRGRYRQVLQLWHNANALLPSNVPENTAVICGPSEHSRAEINSTCVVS